MYKPNTHSRESECFQIVLGVRLFVICTHTARCCKILHTEPLITWHQRLDLDYISVFFPVQFFASVAELTKDELKSVRRTFEGIFGNNQPAMDHLPHLRKALIGSENTSSSTRSWFCHEGCKRDRSLSVSECYECVHSSLVILWKLPSSVLNSNNN